MLTMTMTKQIKIRKYALDNNLSSQQQRHFDLQTIAIKEGKMSVFCKIKNESYRIQFEEAKSISFALDSSELALQKL